MWPMAPKSLGELPQFNSNISRKMEMRFRGHITLFLTLFLLATVPTHAAVGDKRVEDDETVASSTDEQKTTLITLYAWATILPKELIDLNNTLTKGVTKASNHQDWEEDLPQIAAEVEEIRWSTTSAKTNPEIQPLQIASLQAKSQKIGSRLNKLTSAIHFSISDLSSKRTEWMRKKEQIERLEKDANFPMILGAEQHEKLVETVEEALHLIEGQLKKELNIGRDVGDFQITLYSIDVDLDSLDKELKSTSTQQTAPSMLSAKFYSRIDSNLITQSYMRTKRFVLERLSNLQTNMSYVVLAGLVFILVCFAIHKTILLTPRNSLWHSFAKRPVASAVFMGSSINAIANVFPFNTDLPAQWEALLHILTLIAVMRLTKYLVSDSQKRKLLNKLTFFMAMTMTLFLLGLPQVLILLYAFYVSVVSFIYYLFQLRSIKETKLSEAWVKKLWGILPAVVLITGISGYDQLAVIIFSTLLSTIIACLIVWVLYLLHLGFLELCVSLLPFALVKNNYSAIVRGIRPIIIWIHLLILITIQSVIWDIYPTINNAFVGINNFGFDFGNTHISLKFIFTVGIVFYGALIASKAVQILLLDNVLPRYKAEKGVQLSITRLVHYAILTVGFLIMLTVLGFELNQLTLLGGALGVGIGFGLQAIVNNFASGLILLFERPIKVGDTIQLGSDFGEVKQLGLRATIIQTFDNAEIVVPNSDLITGQVTNWTLADRRARVRIPVGVAYGTDVEKVLGILISCAKANPMVLSTPKPNALFLAFGASSLDFELRVWIPEFLDKLQVLSDLNQDIENEFSLHNIEIPFPQSDIHLRSVDEVAGNRIVGKD